MRCPPGGTQIECGGRTLRECGGALRSSAAEALSQSAQTEVTGLSSMKTRERVVTQVPTYRRAGYVAHRPSTQVVPCGTVCRTVAVP